MNTKHKQHFVWKYYLKPWSNNNQIYCLLNNKIILTSLENIANSRDFYRLKEMTSEDIIFLLHFIEKGNPIIKKINLKWINMFSKVFDLRSEIITAKIQDNDIKKALDSAINDLEEEYQAYIERMAHKHLAELQNDSIEFANEEKNFTEFVFYLCIQYFRTENIKYKVETGIPNNKIFEIKNIWNVLRTILATNIAGHIIENREKWILLKLVNASTIPLITGDQPVINIVGKPGTPVTELIFYYPITPKIAILLKEINSFPLESKEIQLSDEDVIKYNDLIKYHSNKQIYANCKCVLVNYL